MVALREGFTFHSAKWESYRISYVSEAEDYYCPGRPDCIFTRYSHFNSHSLIAFYLSIGSELQRTKRFYLLHPLKSSSIAYFLILQIRKFNVLLILYIFNHIFLACLFTKYLTNTVLIQGHVTPHIWTTSTAPTYTLLLPLYLVFPPPVSFHSVSTLDTESKDE